MATNPVLTFPEKVERLCDFLLDKLDTSDVTGDWKVIYDLKEEAANLQSKMNNELNIAGLSDYMSGIPSKPEES